MLALVAQVQARLPATWQADPRRLPLRFDPALPAGVKTVTLSYTFYKNEAMTAALAAPHGQTGAVRAAP